jgi:hypothetical protein
MAVGLTSNHAKALRSYPFTPHISPEVISKVMFYYSPGRREDGESGHNLA